MEGPLWPCKIREIVHSKFMKVRRISESIIIILYLKQPIEFAEKTSPKNCLINFLVKKMSQLSDETKLL